MEQEIFKENFKQDNVEVVESQDPAEVARMLEAGSDDNPVEALKNLAKYSLPQPK